MEHISRVLFHQTDQRRLDIEHYQTICGTGNETSNKPAISNIVSNVHGMFKQIKLVNYNIMKTEQCYKESINFY